MDPGSRVICLIADGVPALVLGAVDVAPLFQQVLRLDQLLCQGLMPAAVTYPCILHGVLVGLVCGANEMVIRDEALGGQVLLPLALAVGEEWQQVP